jgi:outer membrane protein assembly factor BamB
MLPAVGPGEAGVSWTSWVIASIRSSPAIDADGRVYVSHASGVTCHSAGGEKLWSTPTGFCATGGLALGPGLDGRLQVYLGMRDPPAFVALDALTGAKRWQLFFSAPVDGAPAVGPDGKVYFGCDDGKVRAVSPDGAILFAHTAGSPVRSCPAISTEGVIYILSHGGYLQALSATGGLLWSRHIGATSNSSAALGPDGRIYAGNDLGEAVCFDPGANLIYRSKIGGPLGWPAVDQWGQARFGSTDRRLYALDASGSVQWSVPTQGLVRPHMAPVVDPDGHTYFGSADGYLRGVDPQGQVIWQLNLGSEPGPLAGAADGAIVAGTLGGVLVRTIAGPAPIQPPEQPDPAPPGPVDGLIWPPHVALPQAGGDGGWHVQPPCLVIDAFPGAAWPAGVTLLWEANGDGYQSGWASDGPVEITLAIQGEIVLRLWLQGEGLPEAAQSAVTHNIRVDTVAPDVRIALPAAARWVPAGSVPGDWLTVSDEGSGLAQVTILLDGEPHEPHVPVPAGQYVLEVVAMDHAGNVTVARREFGVGAGCSAWPLNPVLVLSGSGYQRSFTGRFITVMLRVPAEIAAAGAPETVMLGHVSGVVVARLPSASAAGLRLYLARFAREPVEAMLAASANPAAEGRLRRVLVTLSWFCGTTPCQATVSLLFRS